jgi:hypothetical protein
MQKLLSGALVLCLSACGGPTLVPPPMPSVADVQGQMVMTDAIPANRIGDFYNAGLFVVEAQCGTYYDSAVMAALKSAQTQGEVNALSGLALGVMGLTGVGGAAVAGAGVGTSFVSSLLINNASNSLAGADPAAMATLTTAAQNAIITAAGEPATAADAWNSLYAVYRQCSPTGIQSLKEQALSAAANHLVVSGAGGAGTGTGARFLHRGIPSVYVQ